MSMIKDIFSGKYEFDVNRFREICSAYEIFDKEFLDNVEDLITKLDYVDLISMCFEYALSAARNEVEMFIENEENEDTKENMIELQKIFNEIEVYPNVLDTHYNWINGNKEKDLIEIVEYLKKSNPKLLKQDSIRFVLEHLYII